LRLIFFGTPAYAVPSLERLLDGPHEVVAVVSQPDRPRGRGRKTVPAPVAELALAHDLPALRPAKVGAPEVADTLREFAPDLGVVVAFGQFMPKRIRELPGLGYCINGHASLLPRWRGAAPIQRAILAGDAETGVCVMRVEREMDAGPVAKRRALTIGTDENSGELSERMAALTAELLAEALEEIADDRVAWTPQPDTGVTLAPKIERAESELDFREPAAALVRRVRAFAPDPGARATLAGEVLRILAADALAEPCDAAPGTVVRSARGLRIATSDGWLRPLTLQRPGKRPLDTETFLRGRHLAEGARFALPVDG
jgi:methionyl-tRNA formyltransferase